MNKQQNAELETVLIGIYWGIARIEAVEKMIEFLKDEKWNGLYNNMIERMQSYIDSLNPLVGIA